MGFNGNITDLNEKGARLGAPLRLLAAAAVVVAAAAVIVRSCAHAIVAAAIAQQEDQNDDPAHIPTAEVIVAHKKYLPND